MLNYKNVSLAFVLFTLVFFIGGFFSSLAGISIYCIVALLYIALLAIGAAQIQMNFYLKSFNRGNPDEAKVALTFDDGPDEETTNELLKILDKYQIKAAFFCIGSRIEKNKSLLKQIGSKGHLIGNHSWSHAHLFDFYLPRRLVREIEKTDAIIKDITGKRPKTFRPPYGVTNPFLTRALKKTGHQVIGWNLRTFDTSQSKRKVLNKIETDLQNGDIILFHDANPKTLGLLEDAIVLIRKKGMGIIGLDELLKTQ
jgi:peptidoglycan/xylan/chitin deacetylase (PgdA/CDA1 family)